MFKNTASQKLMVFAFDSTTNLPKTGDSANLTAYVSKDFGAVTVLGDTTATEMDSTNAKGYYLFDLTQGETNADTLLFSAKSSTANIVVIGAPSAVYTLPPNFTTQSIDSNGRVDVIKIAGTTQTARDLGASVLLSSGTGTGQLDFTSGVVKANLAQILGTALTETAGQISAAFKQFFDVASPTGTMKAITNVVTTTNLTTNNDKTGYGLSSAAVQAIWDALTTALTTVGSIGKRIVDYLTGDAYARIGAPVGASISADIAAVQADTDNIQTRIPAALTADGNIKADTLRVGGTLQTAGDIPAMVTAVDDYVDTEVAAIKAKTDQLTFTTANKVDARTFTNDDKTGYSLVAGQLTVKKNTQLSNFEFVMTDSTTHAPKTLVAVTATRSIDGGAFGACANAVTEVASGVYKITLAAADLNGDVITLRFTGAASDDVLITILTQA